VEEGEKGVDVRTGPLVCHPLQSKALKKMFRNTIDRAESSDLVLGGHESAPRRAISLIGSFLTKTNFLSTNNCLLDTEATYTKLFLMMKITLHDLTPKERKIQDKMKSHRT